MSEYAGISGAELVVGDHLHIAGSTRQISCFVVHENKSPGPWQPEDMMVAKFMDGTGITIDPRGIFLLVPAAGETFFHVVANLSGIGERVISRPFREHGRASTAMRDFFPAGEVREMTVQSASAMGITADEWNRHLSRVIGLALQQDLFGGAT